MAWLGLARGERRVEKEKVTIDPKNLSIKGASYIISDLELFKATSVLPDRRAGWVSVRTINSEMNGPS